MTFIPSHAREFADLLKAEIEEFRKPGDLLLPTTMTAEQYGVTVWIARGAMHLLSREGVIASYSRMGYYVAARDGTPLRRPVPLQRVIADELRRKILDGDYEPQEKLPSLRQLAHKYGSSTAPVRRAIEILQDEDLLTTSQKRGTFVNTPPVNSHEESTA